MRVSEFVQQDKAARMVSEDGTKPVICLTAIDTFKKEDKLVKITAKLSHTYNKEVAFTFLTQVGPASGTYNWSTIPVKEFDFLCTDDDSLKDVFEKALATVKVC